MPILKIFTGQQQKKTCPHRRTSAGTRYNDKIIYRLQVLLNDAVLNAYKSNCNGELIVSKHQFVALYFKSHGFGKGMTVLSVISVNSINRNGICATLNIDVDLSVVVVNFH